MTPLTDAEAAITQETRGSIIQDILGHPAGAPSLAEVAYYNPSKSESTIRNHLEHLVEAGVVDRLTLPEDERTRDDPYVFYVLSETGYEVLDENDWFLDKIDEIREDHARTEKTPKIQRYETAPRPDFDPAGDLDLDLDVDQEGAE